MPLQVPHTTRVYYSLPSDTKKPIFIGASNKSNSYLKACEPRHIRGQPYGSDQNLPSTEKKTLLIKRFPINSATLIRREFIPHQYFTMSAETLPWP